MTNHDRKILEAIEGRKAEGEDSCDSCYGTGMAESCVCTDCLGQGVLLRQEEYNALLRIAGHFDDDLLDAEIIA